MADNTTTQSGTLATVPAGEVFGFDDVGGVKIARSKTGFGADGSYTDVSASDPLPVTAASLPLPSGAATSAKQDTLIGHVDGLEGLLTTIDADTGAIATSAATLAGAVSGTEMQVDVLTMPTVAVTGTFFQATQPVSAASLPLPTGAATLAEQQTQTTAIGTTNTQVGATNETAPGTDTATSGLNGRLQRIAQRLTSLIALFPSSLGQKTKSGSLAVTLASDQDALPVTDNSGSLTVDNAGTFAVQAAQSGTWNITNVSGTVSLPTGAATAAKQPALGTAGSAATDVLTVQGIASMTPLKVDGSGVTQPVSGTVTANAGTGPFPVSDNAGSLTVDAPVGTPVFVRLSDGSSAIATLPVSLASLPALAAGTNAIGKLAANSGVDIGDVDVTSLPSSSSATLTNQNDQATNVTLLASNASRKGFAVFNESTSFLYLKFGATASATSYTVRVAPGGYYELVGAGVYTGQIDGIWSADASGAARITEW